MWKRPKTATYPAIYCKFEGKKLFDGKKRQYWVQDLTEDYHEGVMNHLDGFLRSEPLCKYSKTFENPESIENIASAWKIIIKDGACLLCLTADEKGEIDIAGFNITGPSVKGSDELEKVFKAKEAKSVFDACKHLGNKVDTYKAIGSNTFLLAFGLYVVPKYRGDGLSVEILKARKPLCENVGIKGTATVFTSIFSQKPAYKAGFKDLVTMEYETLEKEDPRLSFPGVADFTKEIKYMYITY